MPQLNRPAAVLIALLGSTVLARPAQAQEASVLPFPVRSFPDENGVDLLTGTFVAYSPSISIGSDDLGLKYVREVRGKSYRDTMMGTITSSGSTYTVDIAGRAESFTLAGSTFTPVEANGSTLTLSGSTYAYVRSDGTSATFSTATYDFGNATGVSIATLTYPSGRTVTYHYNIDSYTDASNVLKTGRRLQSVTSNSGYHIKFSYASDVPGTAFTWQTVTNVKALNSSLDSCTVTAFSCPQTGRPNLAIPAPTTTGTPLSGTTTQTYTDAEGRVTTYTMTGTIPRPVTGIKLPGSAADDIAINYSGSEVSSVTSFGVTTNYSYSNASNIRTVTVTKPGNFSRVVTFDTTKNVMLSDRNELNFTTSYQYDTSNRLTRVTRPEGNYTALTYDARGNVNELRNVAKAGSGLSDIVWTASFPTTCSNGVTCNRPTSVTDPKGNVINYSYDPVHGGATVITQPAPSTGADRPETRYTYTRLGDNGSANSNGIFRVTGISSCAIGTSATCVGTANETKTTIGYGQGLLVANATSGAGDNSVTSSISETYDAVGNLLTIDGPLTGSSDTTRFRYNSNRELIGLVGPDPDGVGSLKNRAQRVTVDARGLITKVEVGTVNGQSDADWAAFSALQEVQQDYDVNRRPTVARQVAGGTTYTLAQASYDNRGRIECSTIRMNSAQFASPPTDACSLGTSGLDGPDRVTKNIYDGASQLTQKLAAFGTAAQATEMTLSYSNNGQVTTLKDAENNLTTYEYDGFDRLQKERKANPTKGSNASSTSDYEQYGYDANSNLISRRLRDGQTINYTFDNLNRTKIKNLPGTEPDVSYDSYDNFGRLLYASSPNGTVAFSYDALGRTLTQSGNNQTASSDWDSAGRRTRLTYPGGNLYIDYDYLVTGEMTKIRENGATSGIGVLGTFTYDNLGRRVTLAFGNGTQRNYSYDPISRLNSLGIDLAGTTNDLTLGTLAYNAASQIKEIPRNNTAYSFANLAQINRSYVSNGLNQYTSAGPASYGYDNRGNLTSDGTYTFFYSSENQLTTGPGSIPLKYDPLMRLTKLDSGTFETNLVYDGVDDIAEFKSTGVLLRRFVFGPDIDEPIVQYEGLGTTTRRFLHADERGSIVATTDDIGGLYSANTYDEYGIPGSSNYGRYQYTGQMWFSQLGVYHYKARNYSGSMGRFLQTDPISVAGGINLYEYAGNEPVNFADPLGLEVFCNDPQADGSCLDVSVAPGAHHTPLIGYPGPPTIGYSDPTYWPIHRTKEAIALGTAPQCSGARVTYSYGGSATAALGIGANVSFAGGISIPNKFSWRNPFLGMQMSLSGSLAFMAGPGFFAGLGEQHSVGIANSPLQPGPSHSYYAEADAGAIESVGASGSVASPLGSGVSGGVSGKLGVGVGLYAGVGKQSTYTLASKPYGC